MVAVVTSVPWFMRALGAGRQARRRRELGLEPHPDVIRAAFWHRQLTTTPLHKHNPDHINLTHSQLRTVTNNTHTSTHKS
jgi:hypothetical protein